MLGMALTETTMVVDENDLAVIRAAAAREGRSEAEYFREAFHLTALRAQRWLGDWDMPTFDLGEPLGPEDVTQVVRDAVVAKHDDIRAEQPTDDQ
jgi:hypothetical protein